MPQGMSEIFNQASKIRIKKDRLDFIRQNQSAAMHWIVHCAYHPDAISLLPKGIPNYKVETTEESHGNFFHRCDELRMFFRSETDPNINKMDQNKRKNLFISFLQSLHRDDAILVCYVKDKKINYPYLTYGFFKEAFPEWLPDRNADTWVIEGADVKDE